jgi:hypothetical protein
MFTLIIIWIQILTAAIIGTVITADQKRTIVFPGTSLINKLETRIKSQELRNKSQEWNTTSRMYKQSSIAIAGLPH